MRIVCARRMYARDQSMHIRALLNRRACARFFIIFAHLHLCFYPCHEELLIPPPAPLTPASSPSLTREKRIPPAHHSATPRPSPNPDIRLPHQPQPRRRLPLQSPFRVPFLHTSFHSIAEERGESDFAQHAQQLVVLIAVANIHLHEEVGELVYNLDTSDGGGEGGSCFGWWGAVAGDEGAE